MYPEDNNGVLVPNYNGSANALDRWVRGDMSNDQDATNVVYIKTGHLWKYNSALGIYKCPADRSVQQGGRHSGLFPHFGPWKSTRIATLGLHHRTLQ